MELQKKLTATVAVTTIGLVLVGGTGQLLAQELDPPEAPAKSEHYWQERFSVHGFLTLAYGDLDLRSTESRSADDRILGLEPGGSVQGLAALNLRWDISPRNAVILQLAASNLGDSPVDDVNGTVELDWFFYQAQLSEWTSLRVGRQPAPAGIYNEIRDVGVILPFFRPAFTFYREGGLFSETVDGVGVSHRFLPTSSWGLDVSAYYGEFTVLEQGGGTSDTVTEVDATDALGTQLWLNTPVEGLRFGLGALRWDVGAESAFNPDKETWTSWYASVDSDREKVVARAEFRRLKFTSDTPSLPVPNDLVIDLYYLQLGWKPTTKLGFYLQPEFTDIEQRAPVFLGGVSSYRDRQDIGVSAVYQFNPNLVLKAEYHEVEAERPSGADLIPVPGGVLLRTLFDRSDSNYAILSLAMSF